MIKEIKGIPIFDLSFNQYIGQYIKHETILNKNETTYKIYFGQYELYAKDGNSNTLLPILMNGLPTVYINLLEHMKIEGFYKREVIFDSITLSENLIKNIGRVLSGKDNILLIDTQGMFLDEYINNLEYFAKLQSVYTKHSVKISELRNRVQDYKTLYLVEKEKNEELEYYKTKFQNRLKDAEAIIVNLETEIETLKKELERITTAHEINEDTKDNLLLLINKLRENIDSLQKITKVEEDKNDWRNNEKIRSVKGYNI